MWHYIYAKCLLEESGVYSTMSLSTKKTYTVFGSLNTQEKDSFFHFKTLKQFTTLWITKVKMEILITIVPGVVCVFGTGSQCE